MSLRLRAIVLAAALLPLSLPGVALAGDAQLRLPAFDHLQRTATDSVNITIGHGLLALAAFGMKHDRKEKDQEALELLRGLKAIYVRSYEFADDNMYSKADIDAVRAQLSAPGWNPLAQVHQRTEKTEDVDVYVSLDHDKVNGLAIIASSPRKFTIVNIVGSIDLDKLSVVEDRFGIPETGL